MTSDFTQTAFDAPLNIYGSTLSGSYAEQLNPPGYTPLPWPFAANHPLRGRVGFWQITLDDGRGPQAQDDKFSKSYAGWASGTADRRFRGYMMNPLKVTYTVFSLGGSPGTGRFSYAQYNSILVMAQGDTANRALYKTTSATDPTPAVVTYTPGSAIISLFVGPIGGATATKRLFIGRLGATVDTHSTIGTSAATMHANLADCWGAALSPVNATTPGTPTWLFYANNGIWSLAITAAVTDAPTQVLSNVPDGGSVMGFETLKKSPFGNRLYMLWPNRDYGSFANWEGGDLKVMHVNEEGTDALEIPTTLDSIWGGRLWQRELVLHSQKRIVRFDGEREVDTNIFSNLAANSDNRYDVVAIGGDDATLRALVQCYDFSSSSASTLQAWEYMQQTNSWLPVSEMIVPYLFTTVTDGAFFTNPLTTINYGQQLPYDRISGAQYISLQKSSDHAMAYQLINPQGINPYNAYRKTGSTDYASKAFTDSSSTSPKWTLPGRNGISSLYELDMRQADIDGGGASTAQVTVDVATQSPSTSLAFSNNFSRAFTSGESIAGRIRHMHDGEAGFWNKFQVKFTLAQASGQTNKTPNASPAIFRGYTIYDTALGNLTYKQIATWGGRNNA